MNQQQQQEITVEDYIKQIKKYLEHTGQTTKITDPVAKELHKFMLIKIKEASEVKEPVEEDVRDNSGLW
tara:strand:+ start:559 stop:765 length:207 start_codon:yes stop_codon:yes gene_type:complete